MAMAPILSLAAIFCAAAFVIHFDFHLPQATDALWLAALALWAAAVRSSAERSAVALLPPRGELVPLALVLPVFAACWLPFHDNWRWAFTGDSFGIFTVGYWFGLKGPPDSLLSVHGIDNFYTRLWETSYNWLMYVFEPTLFWHRVGQLLMSCLALSAIYSFFCLMLGKRWALLVILATMTNHVWLWLSYISYLRTDSFVFYYATLIVAYALWRNPQHMMLWLCAGMIGGLSLFFTPVVWGAVAAVAIVLGCRELRHLRLRGIAIYAVSFLLAATPILTELPWMVEMLQQQALARDAGHEVYWPGADYFYRTFRTIVISAYDTPIHVLGMDGGMLRPPLSQLCLAGMLLAAVAMVGPLRRRLRLPGAAPVLLGLLLWDALLFTATNKGYGAPSHKRFYNLIPLQLFFALLPLHWIGQAQGEHGHSVRRLAFGFAAVAVAVAAALALWRIVHPHPGMYGNNLADGLIEVRQRFARQPVTLISTRPRLDDIVGTGGLIHQTYGIADRLTVVAQPSAGVLADGCEQQGLVCYDVRGAPEDVAAVMIAAGWQPVPLLNTAELRCYGCPA
ncbi:MAG TPA: hypothetical protein VEB21_04590 [Terriglobales bacterium]|nr:hypothetical protein [Terriglobales bacterium]